MPQGKEGFPRYSGWFCLHTYSVVRTVVFAHVHVFFGNLISRCTCGVFTTA